MSDVTHLVGRRATINFIPRAVTDLDWLIEHTPAKQNDAVNRAVQVHAFFERARAEGKKLALVSEDGSVETVNII